MSGAGLFDRIDGRLEPRFVKTIEQEQERLRILAGRFFLVLIAGNVGAGERWRCKRCRGKHRYLSLMCVERPFSGVEGAIYAYFRHVGDSGVVSQLNPVARRRYERMAGLFAPVAGLPDLASSHPRMARRLYVPDRDMDMGALALGLVEPIPESLARKLVDRINGRGIKPPLTVPGINAPIESGSLVLIPD